MKEKQVKVLAVADPAVYVYVKEEYGILEKFNREHGIDVDFDIVPWESYYDTLMKALGGELDYDIVMVAGHLWLKDFVSKGYLAELEEPPDVDYDYKDIIEIVRDEMTLEGTKYLFPSFCDGHMVVYRKSILEEAYGPIDKEVISTNEYIAMAKACHDYKGIPALAMKAHGSEIFLDFLPFLRNEGIEPFDLKTYAPKLIDEKSIDALNKYVSLKEYALEGTENLGNDGVREAFQQKKVAMTTTWGGQLGMVMDERCIDPEDVGFLALNTSWNVTWSFGVVSSSNKKDIAQILLRYLTSKEVDRHVGGFAGSPVRKSTYEIDGNKYPWYDIHREMITKYARPMPNMLNAGAKMGPIYSEVYNAFTGKKAPHEALAKAQSEIIAIIMEESK